MSLGEADPASVGDYTLESRLGSGGMGVVHLGRSPSGRRVAVKVVHAQLAADPEFRARFRQEVAAARRVSGAFTAPVVDADPDAARPWMATLYVPGLTLSQQVKKNGPFPVDELWQLTAGLAEALRDIHRAGVVHRDLKPSNVLLAEDGPKVIDFGISRPVDSDLRTETGKVIGTPPFMAPEQFRSPREVGPAADVFALGCLLVHAALGRGPFDADSPYLVAYQVVHDEPDLTGIPERLRPLVRRCLAKNPHDRPRPDDLMAALRDTRVGGPPPLADTFLPDGDPSAPSAPTPVTHVRGGRRRRNRRWAVLGTAAAMLVTGGTVFGLQTIGADAKGGNGPPPRTPPASAKTWERTVAATGSADRTQVTTAKCAHSGAALYCSGSGVAAQRVDTADGKVRWSRKADWAKRWTAAPAVSGGLVLVVDPGRELLALDPDTGKTRWHADIAGYDGCCSFAGGTVLLTAESGTVTALDGATGKQRWRHPIPGHAQPVFQYLAGTAYAVSVSDDGSRTLVSALRPATGEVAWRQELNGDLSPVGVSGGALYLAQSDASENASETTAFVRYDPAARGATRTPLPFPVEGSTTVAEGGMVYLMGADGSLMAVDTARKTADRAVKWQLETTVSNPSPATVSGHHLYFSASDGRLIAVDLRTGRLAAQTALRLDPHRRGSLQDQPAPIVAGDQIFAYTPRGSVFSVDASLRAP